MPAYFDTGLIVGERSWHGLELESWAGGLVPRGEKITVADAMRRSNMLYTVYKTPIGVALPSTNVTYEQVVNGEVTAEGFMPLNEQYALMRPPTAYDPEWNHLRTVANRYEVLQNQQLADILEDLAAQWPIESVISLKGGQIIAVTLRMEPFEVGGQDRELHETFLLAANDHTSGGFNWKKVATRPVCFNTYSRSLAETGSALINIPHTRGGVEELEFRVAVQEAAIRSDQTEKEYLNALFTRKVTGEEVNEVIKAALPDVSVGRYTRVVLDHLNEMGLSVDPDDEDFYNKALDEVQDDRYAAMLRRAQSEAPTFSSNFRLNERRREQVAENYVKFGDEQPYAGDTAYALFQAVTEMVTHSDTYTGGVEKGAISLLFGQKDAVVQRGRAALAELL